MNEILQKLKNTAQVGNKSTDLSSILIKAEQSDQDINFNNFKKFEDLEKEFEDLTAFNNQLKSKTQLQGTSQNKLQLKNVQSELFKIENNKRMNEEERLRAKLNILVQDRHDKIMQESIEVKFAQNINEIATTKLRTKSTFKLNQQKREKGLSNRRYRDIIENEQDPLLGIFSDNKLKNLFQGDRGQKVLNTHSLDFLHLDFKQDINRITQEMIEQAQQSQFGKELIQKSELNHHKYVPDLAVRMISKNLQMLEQFDMIQYNSKSNFNSQNQQAKNYLTTSENYNTNNDSIDIYNYEDSQDRHTSKSHMKRTGSFKSFQAYATQSPQQISNPFNTNQIYPNANLIKVNITGEYPTLFFCYENSNDSQMRNKYQSKNNQIGIKSDQKNQTQMSLVEKLTVQFGRQLNTDFTQLERRYLKNLKKSSQESEKDQKQYNMHDLFKLKKLKCFNKVYKPKVLAVTTQSSTGQKFDPKRKNRKASDLKAQKEPNIKLEVIKEFLFEEEDDQFQSMYLNYIGLGGVGISDNLESSNGQSQIISPRGALIEGLGGMIGGIQKGRSGNQNMENSDDSKELQFIDFMGLGNRNDRLIERDAFVSPFENIMFFDELPEEESYDYQLIEELFNPQKKIRISKVTADRSRGKSLAGLMSRIDTANLDDSDSSIQENQTYVALQKYQFNQILKGSESQEALNRDINGDNNLERQKTTRRSQKKLKFDMSQLVEFFDPIRKKKGPLSKNKISNKIKDKGSTQKHGIVNKKVPTDNSTQNEHGAITFYSNVSKQKSRRNAFHPRWVMMRGFNLYWYRSPIEKQQKGQIILPSQNIQLVKVGKNQCFMISKDEQGQGRLLRFQDNEQNHDFKNKLTNMIQYKIYLEIVNRKNNEKLDMQLIDFFKESGNHKLEMHDKYLNEEYKLLCLNEALLAHSKLTQLILVNCGLSDDSLDLMLNKLSSRKNNIWHIDLSQNELTQHSIPSICYYIKSEHGLGLRSLLINRNTIYDAGLQNLAVGLFERYQLLESRNSNLSTIPIPIQRLGISDTKFTDNGFKYLLQRFEALYLRNMHNTRDFENLMEIDISRNNISETSLKYLADILRKFNGFKSINMQSLLDMKSDNGWIEFCKALRETQSLQSIDLSKNFLSAIVIQELLHSVIDNYVISEINIDIKGKNIPFGFSNNTLMSMFQIYLTKENIDL
eukprot:403367150